MGGARHPQQPTPATVFVCTMGKSRRLPTIGGLPAGRLREDRQPTFAMPAEAFCSPTSHVVALRCGPTRTAEPPLSVPYSLHQRASVRGWLAAAAELAQQPAPPKRSSLTSEPGASCQVDVGAYALVDLR